MSSRTQVSHLELYIVEGKVSRVDIYIYSPCISFFLCCSFSFFILPTTLYTFAYTMADPHLHRPTHGAKRYPGEVVAPLVPDHPTTASKSQIARLNQLQTYRYDSDTSTEEDEEDEEEDEEEQKRVVPVPSSVSVQERPVSLSSHSNLEEVDEDEQKMRERRKMTREEVLKLERLEAEQNKPKRKKRSGNGGNGHKCVVPWRRDWCDDWRDQGGIALCWYCLKTTYRRMAKIVRNKKSSLMIVPAPDKEVVNTFYAQLTSPPYVLKGSMEEVMDLFRGWVGTPPAPLSYQPSSVKLVTGRDRPKEKIVPEAQYPDPLKALSRYVRTHPIPVYEKGTEYTVVNMCEGCRTSHSMAYRAYVTDLDELDHNGKSAMKPPPLTKEQKQGKSRTRKPPQQKKEENKGEGDNSSEESGGGTASSDESSDDDSSGSGSGSDSGSGSESEDGSGSGSESSSDEEEKQSPAKRKRVTRKKTVQQQKKQKTSSSSSPQVEVTILDGKLVIRVDLLEQIKHLLSTTTTTTQKNGRSLR
jgi:hypothetical protein